MDYQTRGGQKIEQRPEPNKPGHNSKYPVTDLLYAMDGYLKDNLDEVPKFLRKAWDCVIIVSGSGKVRIGKSTLAMQVAYYEAWRINEIKKKSGEVPKDNPVPFGVDNVAFDPDELMKIAERLPRNSVIVYDEGRAGLDSARAMENINKAMQDFFQECGQYGHIIIIVLPDFFKLQETIAVPRSLFLINVYADKNYNRGFFSFFSEHKKEMLYILGKKAFGSTAKYLSVKDNFHGTFSDYFPIDQELYAEKKRKALAKKRHNRYEVRWRQLFEVGLYIMKKFTRKPNGEELTAEEISKFYEKVKIIKVSRETITHNINKVRNYIQEQENYA